MKLKIRVICLDDEYNLENETDVDRLIEDGLNVFDLVDPDVNKDCCIEEDVEHTYQNWSKEKQIEYILSQLQKYEKNDPHAVFTGYSLIDDDRVGTNCWIESEIIEDNS
jgi:hypothetical protein